MQASEDFAAKDLLDDTWVRRLKRQELPFPAPRSLGDDRVDVRTEVRPLGPERLNRADESRHDVGALERRGHALSHSLVG